MSRKFRETKRGAFEIGILPPSQSLKVKSTKAWTREARSPPPPPDNKQVPVNGAIVPSMVGD